MRIAVLAKQVPRFEELSLGLDGRLLREGLELEINPYCRRAIAKGVELARATGGSCVVLTLGPPSAAEVLREAIAWGADEGVLISDPAFAGADTLATARTLAAALRLEDFDLVLAGLNSVDADTGQVGPQLAELLDLPFLGGVRELTLDAGLVRARCERDDGHVLAEVALPAVLTAAERLCPPAKIPAHERGRPRIRIRTAADLGPGPWGAAASPTVVGEVRPVGGDRPGVRPAGPLAEQVREAVRLLVASGALAGLPPLLPAGPGGAGPGGGAGGAGAGGAGAGGGSTAARRSGVVPVTGGGGPLVGVLAEDPAAAVTGELLGSAARLAAGLGGGTVLLAPAPAEPATVWARGADAVVTLTPEPEAAAEGATAWARATGPWALLLPGTSWGREVAGRVSVRLGAGLTGDAVDLDLTATGSGTEPGTASGTGADRRLVCWKSAFGGQSVVAVTATSPVQMATVRPGVLPAGIPRGGAYPGIPVCSAEREPRGRVVLSGRVSDDDPARLPQARTVVGIGRGVDPARYRELSPLVELLGAELAATRKVTDQGWLPRGRQLGITGRSVAPEVYLAIGTSGKFNHMVGVRGARFVLAVNSDPEAPVFAAADAGIVGDWAEAVPLLTAELTRVMKT
ncbi:FAD-binding protein [Actinomadura scrupuli]|uniref:FAD-binding protein n=1 Tax=Actinomadura scrupuli TaxID=559629 RepID=UPI003D958991